MWNHHPDQLWVGQCLIECQVPFEINLGNLPVMFFQDFFGTQKKASKSCCFFRNCYPVKIDQVSLLQMEKASILKIIWMFPKIMVPPNHPLIIGFSNKNHPFWGTSIFGNTLVEKKQWCCVTVFFFQFTKSIFGPKKLSLVFQSS